MRELSIAKKFGLMGAGLVAIGLVLGVISWVSWGQLKTGTDDLKKAMRFNELALMTRFYATDMEDAMKAYLLNPSDEKLYERKVKSDESNGDMIGELKKMTNDPELHRIFDAQEEWDEKELNPRETKIAEVARSGRVNEARQTYARDIIPLQAKYDELSQQLIVKAGEETARQLVSVTDKIGVALWRIIFTVAAGLLAIGIATTWVVSGLLRSLNQIVGELSVGASSVATASSEISHSGSTISSAATEQASALQESVSSIEQVSAMVAKNADNAKKSYELSNTSKETAVKGKAYTDRIIEAIDDISASNRQIAEIVGVITEIGNKTKVINEIVFQTKLLSFNASVEAARAGEHGKGFAVVAEEVGNLAQMSGNAAKEISSMLEGSIQKVDGIVGEIKSKVERLVTEGKRCGSALDEIVKQVDSVNQMASEIATASSEQAAGVAEINKAMTHLDQATNQNSSMSQHSAQVAEKLAGQAGQLNALVETLVHLVHGNRGNPQGTGDDVVARSGAQSHYTSGERHAA